VRIDEFSNMGAGAAGLSDTERVRFACFGFDIASSALALAIGLAAVTFTASKPDAVFTGSAPVARFTATKPDMTFTGSK